MSGQGEKKFIMYYYSSGGNKAFWKIQIKFLSAFQKHKKDKKVYTLMFISQKSRINVRYAVL